MGILLGMGIRNHDGDMNGDPDGDGNQDGNGDGDEYRRPPFRAIEYGPWRYATVDPIAVMHQD